MPRDPVPKWQGSEAEMQALLAALEHNCECKINPDGAKVLCDVHRLPLSQSTLDRLLFMRRIVARLQREEDCNAV